MYHTQEKTPGEVPPILFRLVAFMEERREWSGMATELLTQMGETDTAPNVITKLLNEYHATVLRQNNVRYVYRRTRAGRRIILSRGDSGGGHPKITVTAVTAVNLMGGRAPGLPAHFDWRDDHALCDIALPEAQGRFRRGL